MMLRSDVAWQAAMSEPDAAARAQDGSLAAFTHLVERHEHALLAFLRGLAPSEEAARDLLQDTFYDAWRAVRRAVPPFAGGAAEDEVRRWLFHAAYCRA